MSGEPFQDGGGSDSAAAPRTGRAPQGLTGQTVARLVVISGPSGAGKGTLIARVLPLFSHLAVSISATTRARRAGERDGREYYFLSRAEFLRRVEAGEFLEWAEYGANLYGTPAIPVETLLRQGVDVILEIELQGARQVMERVADVVTVFIAPPSLGELEERLRRRHTETEEAIDRRMGHARDEMEQLARDQLRTSREFHYVIVNDEVDVAAEQLRSAIEDIRKNDPTR